MLLSVPAIFQYLEAAIFTRQAANARGEYCTTKDTKIRTIFPPRRKGAKARVERARRHDGSEGMTNVNPNRRALRALLGNKGVEKNLLTSFEMIGSVIPSRCEESFSWHFDYLQVIVTS